MAKRITSSGQSGGRPRFKPTNEMRRMVEALSGCGLPQRDIALTMDISQPTLRKHFKREIAEGLAKANAQVAKTLFSMATSGKHPAATIFFCKARLGMKESAPVESAVNVTHIVRMPRKEPDIASWMARHAPRKEA